MYCKPRDVLGGPVYFALAIAIGLLGYVLGFLGGVGLSIAGRIVFDYEHIIFSAAAGGFCSALWPAFLRRHNPIKALPLIVIASATAVAFLVAHFVETPYITGQALMDSSILGTLSGGATAMILLLRVPKAAAECESK